MAGSMVETVLEVLTKRWSVVVALRDKPRTKPELVDEVGVSRSTVDRAVGDLEDEDVATYEDGRYRLTSFGGLACEAHDLSRRCLTGLCDARDLVEQLPDAGDGSAIAFANATVVRPEPHRPDLAMRRFVELLNEADRVRGVSPVVVEPYVEVCQRRVAEDGMELDLVVAQPVYDVLRREFGAAFEDVLQADHASVVATDADIPVGMAIIDRDDERELAVVLYSATGISGLIRNDDPAAVGWALEVFERMRARTVEPESRTT
ncbi:helix-turn-helix transcriptional regulator [Haloarchaeobius sp. DFWS5]|uniref:helix-turn-helix transcriptional regulator n=1 Tax=Haloarchaeobius sp. DFWS5 TaxID=3446114 RepID=UPI003EBBABCC